MLLSFQKTSLITLLGQKKAIKVRFSPIKMLFIFMRFPNFQKLIYCGKRGFNLLFLIQNEGKWCFSKKNRKKKFFLPPVSRKLAFYVFSDSLRKYKMLISRKMRNAKKKLSDFPIEKRPFSHF